MENQEENKKSFSIKNMFYRGDKRFILSYLAIIVGICEIGVSISSHTPSALEAGWAIIFGALAYRSAKKRKLNLVKSTKLRVGLEIIAIILSMVVIFTQSDIILLIENDGFVNLVIPLWILIAYAVVNFKTYKIMNPTPAK